jgi:hypothetical protein
MLRIFVLFAILFTVAGCTAEGRPTWMNEALKDARGDNMQMHSHPMSTND